MQLSELNDYDRQTLHDRVRQPQTLLTIVRSYIEDNLLNPRLQISAAVADVRHAVVFIRRCAKNYIRSGAYSYSARMTNFLCLPEVVQSLIYYTLRSDQLYRLFDPPIRKINKFKQFETELQRVYNIGESRIHQKLKRFQKTDQEKAVGSNRKIEVVINGEIQTPVIKYNSEIQGDIPEPSKDGTKFRARGSELIEIAVTEDEYQKIQEMRQELARKQQLEKENKIRQQRLEQRKKEEMERRRKKKNHKVFSQAGKGRKK